MDDPDPHEKWFWKKMQECLGPTMVPKYLINAISMYGLAKGPLLAMCVTEGHINALRDFVRSPDYAAYIPIGADMRHYYGIFARRPNSFEIGFVKNEVLTKMIEFARTKPPDFWDPSTFVQIWKRAPMHVLFEKKSDLKEGDHIIEGNMTVSDLKKFLVDRNLPLRVGLSEDACAIINKIQYDSLTDQGVDIVLPRDKHSLPITGSFPAATVHHIQDMFRNGKLSKLS
ncbi:hypothetical protein QAD02_002284 [Eretmocerus hayati]|uniref:Uncharacterized protein n=1 Tax=Eretmocerus hayati TaxID=131215 RepID=A0ACC2NNA8_9HYME|nr:hypothetical protein QAD02_002284 [Eretmocerus hayati]